MARSEATWPSRVGASGPGWPRPCGARHDGFGDGEEGHAMLRRLRALVIKELLAVLRDPRGRLILIVPPIIQLFVFAYAATMEVKNVDIALLDRDRGAWSQ